MLRNTTLLCSWLLLGLHFPLFAQQPITQFDLSSKMEPPQFLEFEEAGNGDIWLLYSFLNFGMQNFEILVYDGTDWTELDTLFCGTCTRDIAQGPDGRIYVAGNQEGIYRWDDSVWTRVVDEAALAITFDDQGTLVYLNSQGIATFDGNSVSPGNATGLPANIVTVNEMFADDAGRIWILLPSQVYTYEASSGWQARTDNVAPLQIALTPQSQVLLADAAGWVHRYNNGVYEPTFVPNGTFPSGLSFTDFAVDGAGTLWAGTQGTAPGVSSYDGTDVQSYAVADLIPSAILINRLFVSSNHDVWVASRNASGVARITGMPTSLTELGQQAPAVVAHPHSQQLLVSQPASHRPHQWQIYLPTGQLVVEGDISSRQQKEELVLSLPTLPDGLYVLVLQGKGYVQSTRFLWGKD